MSPICTCPLCPIAIQLGLPLTVRYDFSPQTNGPVLSRKLSSSMRSVGVGEGELLYI